MCFALSHKSSTRVILSSAVSKVVAGVSWQLVYPTSGRGVPYHLLRIVFRENYGYSNEYQTVDIRVLLDQHVQCINNYNVLAQAPETQIVEFV